jgi:hypothetical protein
VTLFALLVAAGLTVSPAQDTCATDFSVPFDVGERLQYNVHFGPVKAGEGTMEVLAREDVRGRETWRTRFRVRGGIPFYRVDDVLESWIDVTCFHSLRFVQDYEEGGRVRERRYEIFPDRSVFVEGDKAEQPSVPNPLDDGSFFYFIRTQELVVGESYEYQRYFRPDRNPVTIRVLGKDRIKVPAGTFNTIVIQPIIKTRGIFSDKGEARIWLSDDQYRIMVQMKSKLNFGSLNLYLKSYRPATSATTTPPTRPDTSGR